MAKSTLKPTSIKPGVSKKEGSITEQGVQITNIVIRPVQRTLLDIEKWRNAHISAESINGSRVTLYDLYDDVLKDGFLKRLVAKRVLAVTKNRLRYVGADGKEIEEVNELLNLGEFRKLRRRIQLAKAWGISVIEIMPVEAGIKIFDVPKKHIVPEEGKVVFEQYGHDGIEYRKAPASNFIIEVGEWNDLGYLLESCAYVIYKRGNIADWANYAQIFGMPFREARYDGFNEQVRMQLENALDKAGSAAYAVLPKEAELTFHEMKGTAGSTELYDSLRKAMNEELSVHILGATETTTSSSSSGYAQSETHLKTVNELSDDDKADELSILNEKVRPLFIRLGLFPDGKFAYDEPVQPEVATKLIDMAVKLKNAGVPVADDHFYEISGIPKPENYEELKQKYEADKAAEKGIEAPQPGKKQAPAKPGKKMSVEDEVRKVLSDFFGEALNG